MLRNLRIATACLWFFCTVLLLLPNPWVLFWNHNLVLEYEIGYDHLIMFTTLGLFVELSRRKQTPFFWLSAICIYGACTEILQGFIPPRQCDLIDFCQDCTGGYLGITLGLLCKNLWLRYVNGTKSYGAPHKK